MKIFLLTIGMIVLVSGSALADPPSRIDVRYDTVTKQFLAVIVHKVSNPLKHYIRKITIFVNDKQVAEQYFTKQSSVSDQQIVFAVPHLKMGDVLKVEAFCNVGGKRAQPIKIQ